MTHTVKLWTMPQDYFGETWLDYYSSGFGQSRNSDDLEQSNFAAVLKALGGESETVIVVRESHWAVRWVEWIAIHSTDEKSLEIARGLCERANDYPVLDEDDWCQREQEHAETVWRECYSDKEKIAYIRKNSSQFNFHDFADLIGCARGRYFAGYASDLIS